LALVWSEAVTNVLLRSGLDLVHRHLVVTAVAAEVS
jgi:hypothetical protein